MQFLVQNIIAFALCVLALSSCSADRETPDVILYNGRIYTVSPAQPWADAVAISAGRIVWVGSNDDVLARAGRKTRKLDLQGRFMMPGFIEGHGHFPGLGASLQDLNFLKTKSWDEITAMVAAKTDETPAGSWIIGRGWHQEKWDSLPIPNVLGYPDHAMLSEVAPDNPVMLVHASGHALIANRAAMDIAGVTRETPDPEGGHIVRSNDGAAIGVFEENAQEIITDAYQQYLTTLTEQQILDKWYEGVRLAQDECLKKGITTFEDAGSSLEELQRIQAMAITGKLDIRLWMMLRHTSQYLSDKLAPYPMIDEGNGFFTCRALKVAVDGALGSYGAWLLEPYEDNPGFTGQNTTSLNEVSALADLAARHGLQLCTHAIGDRANREILNLYERKYKEYSLDSNARWRIEHAQHLNPVDIPRFATIGVIASMQGIHCTSDAPFVVKRLGEDRAAHGAYAWRSLLDHGAVVTNGTDAPVEDVDPLPCIYASVTRKRADTGLAFYPEQSMTRDEAIYSYTLANAYAAFEETSKGSVVVGKYADFVVLDHNLLTCSDDEILQTKVLMTIVNGEIKYRVSGF